MLPVRETLPKTEAVACLVSAPSCHVILRLKTFIFLTADNGYERIYKKFVRMPKQTFKQHYPHGKQLP